METKQIASYVVGFTVSFLVVTGVKTVLFSHSSDEKFTQKYAKEFSKGCTDETKESAAFCDCAADSFISNFTTDQLRAINKNATKNPEILYSNELNKAVNECKFLLK